MNKDQVRQAAAAYGNFSRALHVVKIRHQAGEATDEELIQAWFEENKAREALRAALKAAGMAMPSCVK